MSTCTPYPITLPPTLSCVAVGLDVRVKCCRFAGNYSDSLVVFPGSALSFTEQLVAGPSLFRGRPFPLAGGRRLHKLGALDR